MSLNISSVKAPDDLRIDGDLDTRGRPTERASRLNAHSSSYLMPQTGPALVGPSFSAVLARNRTVQTAATLTVTANLRSLRGAADSGDLAPETIEMIGKRRAAEELPRDPRFPQPFEIERTVGAATPERERDPKKKRRPPSQEGGERQPGEKEKKKPFVLEKPVPVTVAAQPLTIEPVSAELAEWEQALLLEDDRRGTVPLIGRAPKPGGTAPVLITGRGRQRGALPTVRRASLPAPRIPASKIIATAPPLGKRVFATSVVKGGRKDPRVQPQSTVRSLMVTGGHPGRI